MKVFLLFILPNLFNLCFAQAQLSDRSLIESIVNECYIGPLYMRANVEVIRKGFHEEFRMYMLVKGELSVQTREEWIEKIEQARQQAPKKSTYEWHYELIDVSDQTAMVKLLINENGNLKYIDYLTLYKFREGWRIITKQFSTYN